MLLLLALLGYDFFVLTPAVWTTRDGWRKAVAQNPAAANGPLEAEFNSLHVHSETLGQAKFYALLALLALTACSTTSPRAERG